MPRKYIIVLEQDEDVDYSQEVEMALIASEDLALYNADIESVELVEE